MTDAIEPAGDAVERVARAMAESAGFAWEACAQEQWRRDARAGLAALPPATASASARALREALEKLCAAVTPNDGSLTCAVCGRFRQHERDCALAAARAALAGASHER